MNIKTWKKVIPIEFLQMITKIHEKLPFHEVVFSELFDEIDERYCFRTIYVNFNKTNIKWTKECEQDMRTYFKGPDLIEEIADYIVEEIKRLKIKELDQHNWFYENNLKEK